MATNDLTRKYFVKNTQNGTYSDFASLFDGLRILKIDGFMAKGQAKNVYTASWEYDEEEDFAIVMQDDEDPVKIIRECTDIDITFIIKSSYATNPIDVHVQHTKFIRYMTNTDVWVKSMYQNELEVHCVCLKEYKPTTEKYKRGTDSWVMGTLSLHMLEQPTNNYYTPIVFEDQVVKQICVENWGGGFIEGEITEYEASIVESLDDKFYGNTSIYKFNELSNFTGLTTLYSRTISGYPAGQFYGCRNLTEVTIPTANIVSFAGAFRQCVKLKELDLTPTTSNVLSLTCVLQITTADASCKKLKLPSCKLSSGCNNLIFYRTGLTTIEIDGTLDLSDVTTYSAAFSHANALSTITGSIVGIKAGISFSNSPLTRESALVIINGLEDGVSGTIDFSDTTMASLTAEDIAIATNKGWTLS